MILNRLSEPPPLNLSPPVILQKLNVNGKNLYVAREDFLEGGTKQRAVVPYLQDLQKKGFTQVVYATPFCGFAQVALAAGAALLKMKVILFCEKDQSVQGHSKTYHAFSKVARGFGAILHICDSLEEAETLSLKFENQQPESFKIPLGFADPYFLKHMKGAISTQYEFICRNLQKRPERIWLPVGSGTLTQVFAALVPKTCQLMCVNVRVLKTTDRRIQELMKIPNVRMVEAPEVFSEKAERPPPMNSNIHYDAKLWRFIREQIAEGDLWWNVAR